MITEDEMKQRIAEEVDRARKQQQVADFGKQWFIEALTHTKGMTERGEFPAEAHQVGQMCFQQFMGIVPGDGGEKPKEENADSKE